MYHHIYFLKTKYICIYIFFYYLTGLLLNTKRLRKGCFCTKGKQSLAESLRRSYNLNSVAGCTF